MATYKPLSQIERENSPEYAIHKFRNPDTANKEYILNDFMDWLDEEKTGVLTVQERKDLKLMAYEFLGYDPKKAQMGEKEMLARWIKATKGENNEQPV